MTVKKLTIAMPVYNEVNTLLQILQKVEDVDLGPVEKEIVMVDDASTDGTRDILKKLQKEKPHLKIFFKDKNSGKGDTLKVCFSNSTGDYVIVQDADLEYDPEDYKKLLRTLQEENVDAVYGSRFSGNYEDMTGLHYFGNKLLTMIFNMLFGVMLTDMETCYKLFPGDFIRNADIKSYGFNFEPEVTAKLLKAHLRIKEVPISYKGRTFDEGKKITWRDGAAALLTLFRFRFFS